MVGRRVRDLVLGKVTKRQEGVTKTDNIVENVDKLVTYLAVSGCSFITGDMFMLT